MKNKTYDKLIYAVLGACLVGIVMVLTLGFDGRGELPEVKKENAMRLGNKDIYEIEFDGVKYIVISKHNGVGICKK